MNPHSEEIAYLKRLISDFPAEVEPANARKAFRNIAARYQLLEQSYRRFSPADQEEQNSEQEYPSLFKYQAFGFHKYLFKDILSNAGEIRKSSDPKGGQVRFVGTRHQQRSKFPGTSPSNITSELEKAFSHLVPNPEDPIENALRFYQHFVFVHPFYDANGRIGRVIVSIYLHEFAYYVQWGEFDGPNNTKFINKLNKCHKRMKSRYTFEKYFTFLLDFFKRYIVSIDRLNELE